MDAARERMNADQLNRECRIPLEAEFRELVLKMLKDFPKVEVFDPARLMFDGEWCWAVRDRKFIYRDASGHPSKEGSPLAARQLAKLLSL